MKFTQAQVRMIAGIGEEKLRTWRAAFAPLARLTGHGPVFSMGDVIAICVVNQMVTQFGIRISALAPVALELFERCESISVHAAGEPGMLLIDRARVEIVKTTSRVQDFDDVTIAVPLGPIVENVRSRLLTERSLQELLPLELQ